MLWSEINLYWAFSSAFYTFRQLPTFQKYFRKNFRKHFRHSRSVPHYSMTNTLDKLYFGDFQLPEALPEVLLKVLPEALPALRKCPSLLCNNYAEWKCIFVTSDFRKHLWSTSAPWKHPSPVITLSAQQQSLRPVNHFKAVFRINRGDWIYCKQLNQFKTILSWFTQFWTRFQLSIIFIYNRINLIN